ncbi:MAG: InlB B-repeat-containing protein [Prevotella sp.]|nr:InlB B-repeat-containing protein [Prevotella sp.]
MNTKTNFSFLARTVTLARAAGARVAITLLLALMTSTSTWALGKVRLEFFEKSQAPIGYLDVIETYACCIHVSGWTCDPYMYVWKYWEGKNEYEWLLDRYGYYDSYPDEHTVANDDTAGKIGWWLATLLQNPSHSAQQNKVEIHLQQNGEDKYVFTYDMNKKREDAQASILSQNNYGEYTNSAEYTNNRYVAEELVKNVNFGFDYWIKIPEPGNYTVVVYGINTHGNQGNTQLTNGNRNISIPQWEYITYDANGGNGPVPETQRKTYIDQITLGTTIPTREGYTFMGWNTDSGSQGTHYNPGDKYSAHAATLYAQWVRNSFYDSYETIRTVEDWNDLATLVNNGRNMRGQTIKLANDIGDAQNPITRTIGTPQYPFDSNFDGDFNSIYVNLNDTKNEGTAPFRVMAVSNDPIWGANGSWNVGKLTVKGTVQGGKYCAGVVGIAHGAIVNHCVVQADIITNSTVCGGVMGYADAYTLRNYCRVNDSHFSGSISGATKQTGVFIGDCRKGREGQVNDCLATGTVSGANIEMGHNCSVGSTYKTFDSGLQGTYKPYDPEALIRTLGYSLDPTNGKRLYWCLDVDGSILPFDIVNINSATDWDNLAARIAEGVSFKGRVVRLKRDITVSTMLGTEAHPFDGTFEGQNNTLTFNLETNESGCAPFRYIKNAEIKDLTIGGTIDQAGGKSRMAGLAAFASGNNKVSDCTVQSTLHSPGASFHHAGFVAQIDGRIQFNNCAFRGRLMCDADSYSCGGFVAINNGYGTNFSNCIFAPAECTMGAEGSYTITRDIKEFATLSDVYYTQEFGDLQGSRVYTTVPDNAFCNQWMGPDNVNYYMPVPTYISGLQHTYNYNGGNRINIGYIFFCGKGYQWLSKPNYTAIIRKITDGTEATEVTEVTEMGSYTLSITANEGSGYYGTVEQPFYVTASSLAMNDQGHFLINSADDWNTLCVLSNDAHQTEYQYFEGRVVELTADIAVNQQLPAFCGTLAGNGHTLTFNLGTVQNPFDRDYAAPIYNLRGNAVVENLHVDGTIVTSTGRFAAGLVGSVGSEGSAQHNVRISNCRSSIRIKTTYNGQCYNGGFVGFARSGKLALNNCLFDGCFTSEDANHVNATHWAGFVGYKGDAAVSINSCLYFANRYEMQVPSANNATFYLPANASVSLQNSCHTEQNWVNKHGTYVAANDEASPQMAALGYEGWYIAFGYPQWQSSYPEGQEWPLVLPRYDYHTAVAGQIEGLQGNGTAADPYLIGSTQDWNVFAASINNNNVGTDAFYLLTDDITIDQNHLVGTTVQYAYTGGAYTEHRTFRGTFNGNGHTLTLNMTTNGDCAPFLYGQDCTVKDLTVDGTITTSSQHAAGLIVNASGTVNITGCRSKLTIASSYSGEGSYAGLVANSTGITNIEGCVFDGNIIGTTFCVGNCNITNSFYTKPVQTGQGTAMYSVTAAEGIDMSIGGDGVLKEYANGITMKGDCVLLDGVFYAPEGANVPIEKLELMTGYSPQDATIVATTGTYANGTLTMPAENVVFTTSTPIALSTYTIRFDANGGTGDAMANMNFTYGDDPVELTANTYTRTANSFAAWNTEADGSGTAYTDGQTVENLTTVSGTTITLYAQWEPWIAEGFGTTDSYTPDGTAEHPYIISTAKEWNLLCYYISSGKGDLASCHYRLGNNFTVSSMMGTETNPFRGTIEGRQCTLTLDLTGVDEVEEASERTLQALAPFAYVDGATIKNLRTTGTISGDSSYYAGGIVGKASGNTTLQSCHSSVAITSTASVAEGEEESPMLGGIVGQSSGTLSLTDCLFDGTINAENTSYCGGFLGELKSGEVTFANCLMDGEMNCDLNGCGTFYQPDRDNNTYTVYNVNNSYYHTAYGAEQGTQTDDTGQDLKTCLGESWSVTAADDVVPFINPWDLGNGKLTLSAPAYPRTGSAITVGSTMKNMYNDVLAEGTDYTVTIKDATSTELTEVTELGEYILTVNGTGNYMGSKSIYFYVYESDGTPFPLQTDDDFESYEDGYLYVRMPRPAAEWPYDEDPTLTWHDAEDNPRIVNIPAGITRKFKVYDDGGKQRRGESGYGDEKELGEYYFGDDPKALTLTCPEGYCFSVQGSMKTPSCHPFTIYDGNAVGNGDVLLDHATGERNISRFITSDNSITFYLDASENWGNDIEGFDLTAQVIPQVPPTTLAYDDSPLEESEKNTSVIAANNGEQISVTLDGRTLYKDGSWNTLCLPFEIPNIAYTPLRGAKVKALSSTSYSDGTLTLDFSRNLTSLEAGKPYIVKWEHGADFSIIDPEYEVVTALNFISEVPEVDAGQDTNWSDDESYDKLVDGNTDTKYGIYGIGDDDPYVDFHYNSAITPKGYALWTANDTEGARNPSSWTISAKNEGDTNWTELVTVDNSNGDKLPMANNTCTIFPLDNDKAYQYFRFEASPASNDEFQLAELQFCTGLPDESMLNIVNPTFRGVTVKDELHPVESGGVTFGGNYSKLASIDGLLLDAHNAGGNAFHATLSMPDVTLYTDAEHTAPVTSAAIPFAADGSVKFYYTQSDLALTLHDDDSGEPVSNADQIAAKDGELAIVTLDGRTLYKDGAWNTISLPFDIADINHSPLSGATVKALETSSYNDGALTLDFSTDDLTSIEAGKPYIVKWEHVDFPAVNPSENLLNKLGFITEMPVVDDDSYNHAGGYLVDGNTSSTWYADLSMSPSIRFHYEEPITPTGYALWTANDGDGAYNPASWTISAKNEGDTNWTELVTVDNSNGDKLPMANSTCTLFELNNSKAYQYFLFEPHESGIFKMAELQFFTARPNTDIVNPVFAGVTIKSQTVASDNIFFEGSYSTLASTDGQMLDAHNDGGKAFHAALNLSSLNVGSYDVNCYSDAGLTTPAAGTIPFNATTGSVTLYPKWTLTLNNDDSQAAENEKNTDIISSAAKSPIPCDVTLAGRTLYKDGDWNTLCLPFSLGDPEAEEGHYFDGTLLEGATVKTLESTSFEDGILTMNFIDAPVVIAGLPYLVKWEAQTPDYVENPVFEGVSIKNDVLNIETDYVDFVGTHSSTVIYEEGTTKHNLYLGSGNNIYYPTRTGYTVNACRAYFRLNGLTAGDPANQGANVLAFVLDFGDGEVTGISEIRNEELEMRNGSAWYTLDGRRLNGKPTVRGLYINNGRKVVIK